LQLTGRTQEAISSADTASPTNEYVFKIFKNLILPIVYDTPDEISFIVSDLTRATRFNPADISGNS